MIDGKALKRARQAAQLTQAGLAKAVGMAAQQLAAIEQGRVKTTKFLAQLARTLNVPLGELDPDWVAFDAPRPRVARGRRDAGRDERGDADYTAFAAEVLRIRAKSGATLPLVFNRAQRHIHDRLEAQRAELGRVRALVLKGRQQGCSTYIGGRFYHRTSRGRGLRAFILTHETRATQNLFEMVERFHANCPEAERPLTGAANAEELWFSALDDSLRVQVTIKTDGRFHKHLSLGEKRIETLATDVVQHAESDDDFEIITGYNQRIRQDEVFVNEIVFIDSLGKSVKYADAWEHLGAFFKRLKKAGALG